jgi:hypothetical protein
LTGLCELEGQLRVGPGCSVWQRRGTAVGLRPMSGSGQGAEALVRPSIAGRVGHSKGRKGLEPVLCSPCPTDNQQAVADIRAGARPSR